MVIQSGHQFRQEIHPLTFMLQNVVADIVLWHHGLHWQQSWNSFFIQEASKILRQLQVSPPFRAANRQYKMNL